MSCCYCATKRFTGATAIVCDRRKVGDAFIYVVEGGFLRYEFTHHGGSVLPGMQKINYCPMCGRKLEGE